MVESKEERMHKKLLVVILLGCFTIKVLGQVYPQGYFRSPLNIPMALVANFGEIRANHWHMGLDVRTQQKVNLPVYAAADGYVSRIGIEPGGFGQAIYITHPNGFTTLYGHLNAFFPALAQYIKEQQYAQQSWRINLTFSPTQFPVHKGDFIALSGSTGTSQGPHVHFEIRDTKTEKVVNPLLFDFPIADAVPPSVYRLAMYDRTRSTYDQSPQLLNLQKTKGGLIKTGSNKISFAIGAVDKFSGSSNPNGIYSATVLVDGAPVSSFALNNIGYDETRYINAQIDYPYAERGGGSLQHLSPLPGATTVVYNLYGGDGMIHMDDNTAHEILIEVKDANGNTTRINFSVQYEVSLAKASPTFTGERLLPNNINIFERSDFELVTTEKTIYDTVKLSYTAIKNGNVNAVSAIHTFLSAAVPFHDSVTVRIKPSVTIADEWKEHIIIKNVCGSKTVVQKAAWQKGWLVAKFRQAGSYQAFIDNTPPTINAVAADLSKASRIVFTPTDNFGEIKSLRVTIDDQWLRFSNDKGRSWIYTFDEKFPAGEHQLKVIVEDEAGNVSVKEWKVKR